MSNFYIGESEVFPRMLPTKFDSLGKGVSEKKIFFRNQPIRTKNDLWRPCLLPDRN